LNVECDELWSFVDGKQNKQWVWLAMDRETREIIGVYIGDRSEEGTKQLWNSLPPVYRQCAVCYTDFWEAYACIFPRKRHQPVGKDSGETNHIERFNNTWRQRVSRSVRKTLSFSKKLENHIGAIWYFIHHYNCVLSQGISNHYIFITLLLFLRFSQLVIGSFFKSFLFLLVGFRVALTRDYCSPFMSL